MSEELFRKTLEGFTYEDLKLLCKHNYIVLNDNISHYIVQKPFILNGIPLKRGNAIADLESHNE